MLLFSAARPACAGYELELVVGGLDKPLYATHAPGDPDGLYVVQQRDAAFGPGLNTGTIVRHDLVTGATNTFLQVTNLDTDTQGGLHSLAFHPDYQPGVPGSKMYLIALEPSPTPLISNNTLQEWVLDVGGTPQFSRTLLQFPGLETNDATHAMDWVGFRPGATGAERDWLYMSVGDGGVQGNENDFVNNPQDLSSLRGKVLRLDVSGVDAYPADNDRNYGLTPTIYFGDDDTNDGVPGETAAEVYYSGLRNPWRMSFDRENGDIWIGDVGAGGAEEINHIPGGVMGLEVNGQPAQAGDGAAVGIDFGWARREGFSGGIWVGGTDQDPDGPGGIRPDSVDPVDDFTRFGDLDSIRSITGGYVYRGPSQHPAMQGKYFFGGFDFPAPAVFASELDGEGGLEVDVLTSEINASLAAQGLVLDQLSSFGEDAEGNLYLIDFGDECSGCSAETGWTGVLTQFGTGEVYRLVFTVDPMTGDFNSDGKVDILDLDILSGNFGTMGGATQLDGDANSDGNVDILDLDILSSNFGSMTSAAVPEPASAGLAVAVAGLALTRISGRRSVA